MELFNLALQIETKGQEQAKQALGQVAAAGEKAAAATDRFNGLARKQQEQLLSLARSGSAASDGFKSFAAKIILANGGMDAFQVAQRKVATETARATQAVAQQTQQVSAASVAIVRHTEHTGRVAAAQGEATLSAKSLEHGLLGLAREATGLNSHVASLANVLGSFAIGAPLMVGILLGVAAVASIYDRLTSATKKAKEETDKLIDSLVKQKKAEEDATVAGQKAIVTKLQNAVVSARQKFAEVDARTSGKFGLSEAAAALILNDRTVAAKALKDAKDAVTQATKNEAQAERDADKVITEGIKGRWERTSASWDLEKGFAAERKRWADEAKQASEAAIAAAQKESAALDERIKKLTSALIYDDLRTRAEKSLAQIEASLTAALHSGNLTLARRIDLEEKLTRVQEARARQFSGPPGLPPIAVTPMGDGSTPFPTGPLPNISGFKVPQLPDIQESGKVALAAMAQLDAQMKSALAGLSQTLGDGIYAAFEAAFNGEGLGGIFKAFGKTVLAGIGSIFAQMGQAYLSYGLIMTGLVPSLANPITAGPTAIAIGVLLTALGGALGAIGRGRGGGSTPNSGSLRENGQSTATLTRIRFVDSATGRPLEPMQPKQYNFTVIGTNDPKAQREIKQLIENGDRRSA